MKLFHSAEQTLYNCKVCTFQSKHQSNLNTHVGNVHQKFRNCRKWLNYVYPWKSIHPIGHVHSKSRFVYIGIGTLVWPSAPKSLKNLLYFVGSFIKVAKILYFNLPNSNKIWYFRNFSFIISRRLYWPECEQPGL